MLEITNAEASANILRFADEGRLTQSRWHAHGDDGREIACLLGSIDPSVTSAAQCNGALMPMWLAELTPTLFDGIPASEIVPIARRYGGLVARWGALSPEAWERIRIAFLMRCIEEAVDAARPASNRKPYWAAEAEAAEAAAAAAAETAWAEAAEAAAAEARAAAAAAEAETAWAEAEAAEAAAAAAAETAWAAAAAAEAETAWAEAAAAEARAVLFLGLFTFLLDRILAKCDAG